MVSKKIGSVGIIITVILFLISGLTLVYNELDKSMGLNVISSELHDYENNISQDTKDFNQEYDVKVTESGDFVQPEDLQVETRGADSSGLINKRGKNIITKFMYLVFDKLDIPVQITVFLLSLIGITISILLIRFFWGDSRV